MSSTHQDTSPPLWGVRENGGGTRNSTSWYHVLHWLNVKKSPPSDLQATLQVFSLKQATQVFHVSGSAAICWLCFSYRTHFSKKQKALFSSIFLVSGFLLHLDFSAVPAPLSKKTLRFPSLPPFSSSLPALSQFSHQRRHPVRHREWMENMTGSFSPWLQIMCKGCWQSVAPLKTGRARRRAYRTVQSLSERVALKRKQDSL